MTVEMDRTCAFCTNFLPVLLRGPSDEGICLLDDDFEPYRTKLVEQGDYECCLPLIQERKFDGNRDACDAFSQVSPDEIIEIDEETPFGKALGEAARRGPITREVVERLLMEERLRTVDLSTVPVDGPLARLRSGDPAIRHNGLFALCSLASQENAAALDAVGEFLRSRPTPLGIDDVRDMAFALRQLRGAPDRKRLVPFVVDQLARTPSNNTTRQWIWAILEFLRSVPSQTYRAPLERMLDEGRFSTRLKRQLVELLDSDRLF